MAKVVLQDEGLLVVDELMPASLFDSIEGETANGSYHSVHSRQWDKAWRLWDGSPLRGSSVLFDPQNRLASDGPLYPTATSVDDLIDAIRDCSSRYPDKVGLEGSDWIAMYLSPWLYPVGSALSLHKDDGKYSGAFTYFLHSRWETHWGGELIVSQTSLETGDVENGGGQRSWISDEINRFNENGIATCITPCPNRLVLLASDRPHRVTRVDTNAGAHVRMSIAGFFLRP